MPVLNEPTYIPSPAQTIIRLGKWGEGSADPVHQFLARNNYRAVGLDWKTYPPTLIVESIGSNDDRNVPPTESPAPAPVAQVYDF